MVRIAHHLSRHESLTVRKMLIMFDNLCLDVIQFAVDLQSLLATAFGTIALYIPNVKRNRLLTAELRLSPINRNPAQILLSRLTCTRTQFWGYELET